MRFTTSKIPVKRFVYKYITSGNELPAYFYRTLHALVQKQEVNLIDENCKYSLCFEIPEQVFKNKGYSISKTNCVVLNAMLEGFIYGRFEHEIEANIRRALREQKSFQVTELMNDLCGEFNLSEEDLPYETIRKFLYRRRIEIGGINLKKIKKIFPKSVTKKTEKADTFGHLMRIADFCKQYKIHERTFRRYKKKGIIQIETIGCTKYVNINMLPATIKIAAQA